MAITYTTNFVNANGTSISSSSLTVAVNDVIAVLYSNSDNGASGALSISKSAGTSTISAFTNIATTNTGSQCKSAVWFCTVTGAGTLTVTVTSGSIDSTMGTYVVTGADTSNPCPVGNRFSGIDTNGDTTQSITPTASGSMLLMITGDWNATNTYTAAANCTLDNTRHVAGQFTCTLIRPTTQPRTDANAFTIGEADTGATNAWVAFEIKAAGGVSANLTGSSSTFSAGSLVKVIDKSLSGIQNSFNAGSLTGSLSGLLVGQQTNSGIGSLSANITKDLTGIQITFAGGTIVVESNDVTLNLTGQSSAFSSGNLANSLDKSLSGIESLFNTGNLSVDITKSLSGIEIISNSGNLSLSLAKDLSGLLATFSLGTITASIGNNVSANLIGQVMTIQAGNLSADIFKAITGQLNNFGIGTLTPELQKALSGIQISSNQGGLSLSISTVITGQIINAAQGTITVEGQEPTVTLQLRKDPHFIVKNGKVIRNKLKYKRYFHRSN